MNEPQGDSPTPHQAVAAEVRAQLARRRMSGRRAAFALGWKQPYIARRLSGEIPFDVNDLTALAQLLELPVSEFFEIRGGLEQGFKMSRSLTVRDWTKGNRRLAA
jgi:transcriptional regulator with XRE-family HTH domain